jgi:hypothetical protein
MAAAVLAPVASHVGLQIVLQPYQHTLGHIAWYVTSECIRLILEMPHHRSVIFLSTNQSNLVAAPLWASSTQLTNPLKR